MQEVRNVLTFWEDCHWHASSGMDHASASLVSGCGSLNWIVNELSRRVTIHSVSHSQLILPFSGTLIVVRLFATVVYTGPSALGIYGTKNPHGPGAITADTTVLEVRSL